METNADARKRAFAQAYDAVLGQWPVAVDAVDVTGPFGRTHVHVAGPADAPPLLLLPGAGATSTVWFANVAALAGRRRLYAPDTICDAGRSVPGDRPARTPEDLMAWLDSLLAGLGVTELDVCGHSYGAQIALSYALHAPARVRTLILLDPTDCFAGFSLTYLLHALPILIRPNARRQRRFLRWETGGRPLDHAWCELAAANAGLGRPAVVRLRRPAAAELGRLTVPTLVLLGGRSRAHRIDTVAARAHGAMPGVVTDVLAGASHHSIPTEDPDELNRRMAAFLDRG